MLKMINKEDMLKDAINMIEEYTFKNEVCEVIVSELAKIDGKKITKRVATSIENALKKVDAELKVSYSKDSMGWYNFNVWTSSVEYINYNNRISLMISTSDLNDDETYNHEGLIGRYRWLTNWNDHIEEVKKDIEMIENYNVIETYNDSIKGIQNVKMLFKSTLKHKLQD